MEFVYYKAMILFSCLENKVRQLKCLHQIESERKQKVEGQLPDKRAIKGRKYLVQKTAIKEEMRKSKVFLPHKLYQQNLNKFIKH